MAIKSIRSKAPTRIDLAGGTVDIWPLYLFLRNPVTINLGIDLFAEANIEISENPAGEGQVTLRSEDLNHEMTIPWEMLGDGNQGPALDPHPAIQLHFKLLRHFFLMREREGVRDTSVNLKLSTRAKSPAGAGLGGSSTLSIAMIGALATWARHGTFSDRPVDPIADGEDFIEIVRDIESTVIQGPAGMQDYYGAMFGGLQALRWRPGKNAREWLPGETLKQLEKRILLFYSGQSRNSGINNWHLFKDFIDRQEDVRRKFDEIMHATQRLEESLKAKDWKQAGDAIAHEWEVRRTLAPGITTPEIDRAFSEARKLKPFAGKVCGAGGGGCFFLYLPDGTFEDQPDLKTKIEDLFGSHGIRSLPFHAVSGGLEVELTRE